MEKTKKYKKYENFVYLLCLTTLHKLTKKKVNYNNDICMFVTWLRDNRYSFSEISNCGKFLLLWTSLAINRMTVLINCSTDTIFFFRYSKYKPRCKIWNLFRCRKILEAFTDHVLTNFDRLHQKKKMKIIRQAVTWKVERQQKFIYLNIRCLRWQTNKPIQIRANFLFNYILELNLWIVFKNAFFRQ